MPQRLHAGVAPAIGFVDELRFFDARLRDLDPAASRRIPANALAYVRGWSLAPNPPAPASAALVTLGALRFEATYGFNRSDVAAAIGDERCAQCGFRALHSIAGLPLGFHELRVAVIAEGSGTAHPLEHVERVEIVDSRRLLGAAELVAGRMRIVVDTVACLYQNASGAPAELGVKPADVVVVTGSAYDPQERLPAGAVFAVIDGDDYYAGITGLRHHDASAPQSGFVVRFPARGIVRGEHEIRIAAVSAGGDTFDSVAAARLRVDY